jgi:hypothetical protein
MTLPLQNNVGICDKELDRPEIKIEYGACAMHAG